MADPQDLRLLGDTPKAVSRRRFIQGVIAGGAAVSSANYLFRASALLGQGPGAGERLITINVNGQLRRADVMKQETLAWTLRYKLPRLSPQNRPYVITSKPANGTALRTT